MVPLAATEVSEDYLLEKNPGAGAKTRVDVEGQGLKIADL
jgi:hypothetical protein